MSKVNNSSRTIDKYERKEFVQFMWTILEVKGGSEKEEVLAGKLLDKYSKQYQIKQNHPKNWDNAFDLWKFKLRFDLSLVYQHKRSVRKFSFENKIGSEIKFSPKTEVEGFYASESWHRLSRKVKNIYGTKCMCCGSFKRPNTDHVKPRSKFPELALEISNMQVLCELCNGIKSNVSDRDFRSAEDLEKLADYLLKISETTINPVIEKRKRRKKVKTPQVQIPPEETKLGRKRLRRKMIPKIIETKKWSKSTRLMKMNYYQIKEIYDSLFPATNNTKY